MMHYLLLFDAASARVFPCLRDARLGSSLDCDGVGDSGGMSYKLETR